MTHNINPHTIGIVMKECVSRAMREIRQQRTHFQAKEKTVDYKESVDLVTSADLAAQAIYVKILRENFPYAGIIAEENFSCPYSGPSGENYYFTVDPLDGTKAYGRRQSHGVTTMVSFVSNGIVEGVTIGDPNTLEIYHSRPGSTKVHRIFDFTETEQLLIDVEKPLTAQYILLSEHPEKYSITAQEMMRAATIDDKKLFHGMEVASGSIGAMFARLWKSEIGAILLPSYPIITAWDSCPVFGMSVKLGFVLVALSPIPHLFTYAPIKKTSLPYETLCIHSSRIHELRNWFKQYDVFL